MGLQRCVPLYGQIEKMKSPENFDDGKFMEGNINIKENLKANNPFVVRYHCHFTGKYRGAAHQHCNIIYRKTYTIPSYFHNFTGYDSHHIFKHLSSLEKAPKVIAKSLEKFTSMQIGRNQIRDSLQFMGRSLDKLVSDLKEKGKKDNLSIEETFPTTYTYFKKYWPEIEDDAFKMLTRKGVYPATWYRTFLQYTN